MSGGYRRRDAADYDKELCLIPKDVLGFIFATQPKEWQKMLAQHGADAKPTLFRRLASEIHKHGTLRVLRKGIKANGCKFRLVYFRPSSGLNESAQELYLANQFTIIIDEAHSSQSGESTKSLKTVLAADSLAEAEKQDAVEGDDLEDRIVAEMKRRGRLPNVSYFAFSGTVKDGGKNYTESGMNTLAAGKRVPETATAETFKQDEFRLLIVATHSRAYVGQEHTPTKKSCAEGLNGRPSGPVWQVRLDVTFPQRSFSMTSPRSQRNC